MEGHAGAGGLNEAGQASAGETAEACGTGAAPEPEGSRAGAHQPSRPASRLGRRALIGACAVIAVLAAAVGTAGYFALRSHQHSQAIARDNAAAVAAAKDCVAATQAPDEATLPDAQRKIVECSTGQFGAQAALYANMLLQAYQAADVHVQLADMRAAVERNNPDDSIDLLMALRVKVDNIEAQGKEFGYRLRVNMAQEDGQYKIARLDQVAG